MRTKPIVISIAAVSGGGKSTITNELYKHLPHSRTLFFDDYEFEEIPVHICDWVARGANYDEWILTPLINDLEKLLVGDSETIKYVIIDYPFAYLNKELSQYIDFAVYIDTPLDVAMARRLLRDFKHGSIIKIRDELSNYLCNARPAYIEMITSVKPSSNLVMDGTLTVEMITQKLLDKISKLNHC